ncbi:MAG: hypothetical protein AB7T06_41695 [Kofleriaceae bacterium]
MNGGVLEQILAELVALRAEVAALRQERGNEPELTIAAFAAARSMGQSTVRAAIREGRLQAERYGRTIRIARDAQIAARVSSSPTAVADRVLRVVGGGK